MPETVKVSKVYSTATLPTRGSVKAAGYDLHANIREEYITIPPHETIKVGTGVSIQPPKGYFGAIFPRSGLATKYGLRPANCIGVCDEDYTGEYIVAIHNDTNTYQYISHGDRIAQLVFLPYLEADFVEVNKLEETERGAGGFGSTGK